jgi:UDP-N-acetylmuramoylalanine--D-glutamate ligase
MILIVGMARSGIAAARLLKSQGRSVFVTDAGKPASSRELDAMDIPYETGGHTPSRFLGAEEIVVSPGVPLTIEPLEAARRKGISIVGELEVAHRYLNGEIVAITGSNGKTTTTTLVGEILKTAGRPVQVGGNIGTALCDLVGTSTSRTINVVEVSSFQLDSIRDFRPKVGVLLNITPDHLDRYTDFPAYRASKFRLFENQRESDVAVLNQDDPQCQPEPGCIRARKLSFSRRQRVEAGAFQDGRTLYLAEQPVMEAADVSLRGGHNIENVLASMTVAGVYDIDRPALAGVIRAFRGVEHRIEYVLTIRGVQFFNDSKATNVDSAIKAVESFEGNLVVILGGKDKGASYAPLVDAMRNRVKHIVLIGTAADRIAASIGDLFPVARATSMEDAVRQGFAGASAGDVVLLSPACASFDMFDNYEHRGKVFKESVSRLEASCQRR